MDKIAIGPGYEPGLVSLSRTATENVAALAKAKGVPVGEIIACVLDRPRHSAIIAELRALGCGIMLIPDGDVAGVIATTDPDTGVDMSSLDPRDGRTGNFGPLGKGANR
jgi:fructose-1,6-bisphosphatase II / sedoheptulose-1,7-bisphosphatase